MIDWKIHQQAPDWKIVFDYFANDPVELIEGDTDEVSFSDEEPPPPPKSFNQQKIMTQT